MNLNDFGQKLREKRTECNMTQEELAFNANVAVSQVGRIERGEINTGLSMVLTLSKALNIKPHELLINDNQLENSGDVEVIIDALTSIFSPEKIVVPPKEENHALSDIVAIISEISFNLKENSISRDLFEQVMSLRDMGYWELDIEKRTVFLCKNLRKKLFLGDGNLSLDSAMKFLDEIAINEIPNVHDSLFAEDGPKKVEIGHSIKSPLLKSDIAGISNIIVDKLNHNKVIGVTRFSVNAETLSCLDDEMMKLVELRQVIQETIESLSPNAMHPMHEIQSIIPEINKIRNDEDGAKIIEAFDGIVEHCCKVKLELDEMMVKINKIDIDLKSKLGDKK